MRKVVSLLYAPVVLLTGALVILGGCAPTPPPSPTSQAIAAAAPPVVKIVMNPDVPEVLANQQVTISVEATGVNLKIEWHAKRGRLSDTEGPSTIYTAPNEPGPDAVDVTVTSDGGTTVKTVSFNVVTPPTSTPLPTHTPPPTDTPTPTPAVTDTPTFTPTPTSPPPPADTPTPQPDAVVNAATLNLRAGPGTQYEVVGQLRQGDALTVTGKNDQAGEWLKVVTIDGTEGWVARQHVNLYVSLDQVMVVPTPVPPTREPQPPLPKYAFGSGTMGWVPQEGADDTKAVIAVAQSWGQTRSGRASLELTVNLIGGNHPTNSKGEAFVDMRYNLPNGVTEPAPYDLTGQTITCWVYAPPGSAGNPNSPNGFQVFVKDENWWSEYGTWENITPEKEGTWFPITLTPSTQTPRYGYKDPAFDPAHLIALGVKIGAGGQSTDQTRYAGPIYIDSCDW